MSKDVKILLNCWLKNLSNIDSFVRSAINLNVDGVELSLDYPLTLSSPESRRLAKLLADNNLLLAVHLPWREVHLASPIREVRLASLKVVRTALGISEYVPIEYVLTHLSTNQAFCGPNDRVCIDASVESLASIAELANDLGTNVLVETVADRCCSNEEKLPAVLEKVNLSSVGVCIDLPHIIERRHKLWGASLGTVVGVLRDAPPVILERAFSAHVHGVKRIHGQVMAHVMPSRRFLSHLLREYIENLNRLKYVTIEVFRDGSGREVRDLSALEWIIERLRRL